MFYLAEIKKKLVLFRDNHLLKSSKSLVTGSQVSNTNIKRNEIIIIQRLWALMIHVPLLDFLLNVTPSPSPSRSQIRSSLVDSTVVSKTISPIKLFLAFKKFVIFN